MESDDPLDGLFDIDANNNPPLLAQEPYHNFQPFDPSYPEIQPFNDLSTLQLQLQNQNFPYPYQNYGPTIIDSQPQNESFNFPVNHQNFILPFHLPTQYPFSPYPEGPFYPIQPNHFINNFSNQSDRSQLFDTQLFPQSQQFQQPPNPQPPLPQSKTEPKIFKSERLVVQNTIPLETVHYSQTFQFPPKTNRKQTLDQTPKFPDSFEYGPTTIPNSAPFDPLDGVFENNQTQSSRDLIGEVIFGILPLIKFSFLESTR